MSALRYTALVPVVRGEKPVILRANRESEIRSAVRFADEMKLKAIILGGDDSAKVASLLKEKNIPVILTGIMSLPLREDDYYDALYETAAKLKEAGVPTELVVKKGAAHGWASMDKDGDTFADWFDKHLRKK